MCLDLNTHRSERRRRERDLSELFGMWPAQPSPYPSGG
jgi:hypothetical protein